MKNKKKEKRKKRRKRERGREGRERGREGREGENQTVTVEGCRGETWQREKPLISRARRSFSAT